MLLPHLYNTCVAVGSNHLFLVTMAKDINEFCVDSRNSLNRWMKVITLLITFPYSAMLREPTSNTLKQRGLGMLCSLMASTKQRRGEESDTIIPAT